MQAEFKDVYPGDCQSREKRYKRIIDGYHKRFGPGDIRFFSVSGRTELGGNHTDHNHGVVLAASIDRDSVAAVLPRNDTTVNLFSEGFGDISVDLADLEPRKEEEGTPAALIRGVASAFKERRYAIGGWNGYLSGEVLPGSGLSSSASVEMLLGTVFNSLYNDDAIDVIELAVIGRYAENHFFGKPCGLMDQIACGSGGVVSIDFSSVNEPKVEKIINRNTGTAPSFEEAGYLLFIVNTGGSHADLTPEYAAVTREMAETAACFNKKVLRDVDADEFFQHLPKLREQVGDRGILRAIHFFRDSRRAEEQAEALKHGKTGRFLELVRESGISSLAFLQNCSAPTAIQNQSIPLGISLSGPFTGKGGACRVHGGGFAGTIQAYIPLRNGDSYTREMERIFGEGSVMRTSIRELGAVEVIF
jgi:galactokinase